MTITEQVVPIWLTLPYWLVVSIAIINIISILSDSSTKIETNNTISGTRTLEDIKRRDKISIIPRLYFIVIYMSFLSLDTSVDWRVFWGRWGIFLILFIDSYCHMANYIDYHWYTISKIFTKNFIRKKID